MAGFLLTAVGIPDAFGRTGLIFGLGYVLLTCVHTALFAQSDVLAGVLRFAPYNLGAAAVILAAAFVDRPAKYVLWVAAFVLQFLVPYLLPSASWVSVAGAFQVRPAHFIERHGLLVIVALGESVITIGMGARTEDLTAGTTGTIVLALALPAALWWAYFSDTTPTIRALDAADPGRRARLAFRAQTFTHILLLLGIVVATAGIHAGIAHPGATVGTAAASALSGGVALFLLGMAELRRAWSIAPPWRRLIAAVAVVATIPIGTVISAGLQLATVIVVLTAMLLLDVRGGPGRATSELI